MKSLKHILFYTIMITIIIFISNLCNAQWTKHSDVEFSDIITSIQKNEDYTFVIKGASLYRSNDGENWEKIYVAEYGGVVSLLCSEKKIFIGFIDLRIGYQFFMSTDNGENWTEIAPIQHNGISDISYYDGNIIYRSREDIYFSSNMGVNWKNINTGIGISSIAVYESKIFGATGNGMYISSDNGNNWSLYCFEGISIGRIYNFNNHIFILYSYPPDIYLFNVSACKAVYIGRGLPNYYYYNLENAFISDDEETMYLVLNDNAGNYSYWVRNINEIINSGINDGN